MIAGETDLDALFKRLHLANARRVWRDLVQRAEREAWAYRDFLTLLATEEIAHRQQTRLARLTRRAHFPFLKTIDDFNFTYQSSLRLHMLGSALAPDFVTEGRTLIFTGKPGRGKTHLAIAVAYRAIQNGFDAVFTTAATLIDDLSAAFRAGELAQALPTYTHPAVLVVDEVGYLTYGTDAANMLFHVVNERHRRHRAMIFTTNKALKAWGRVLHDEDLAHAIIDRVLERGRLLRLDGPSVRTLHVNLDDAMKEDSDQQTDLARISGKTWPEFLEPTYATFEGREDVRRQAFERILLLGEISVVAGCLPDHLLNRLSELPFALSELTAADENQRFFVGFLSRRDRRWHHQSLPEQVPSPNREWRRDGSRAVPPNGPKNTLRAATLTVLKAFSVRRMFGCGGTQPTVFGVRLGSYVMQRPTLSKRAPSTTRPSLRFRISDLRAAFHRDSSRL
jgi:DNA replication protein DnaC